MLFYTDSQEFVVDEKGTILDMLTQDEFSKQTGLDLNKTSRQFRQNLCLFLSATDGRRPWISVRNCRDIRRG